MRSGGCTIQQTLTVEAASVLKHSLNLARRRGHAQVTPLHVAATLLSSRSSLLRRACIKSHPGFSPNYQIAPSHHHPLHCRALELCFNVALNRLPTIPGPMFHGQPSLANALIAALKRAQAHQRRGCIEQQQQQQQPPLLTIKVELEQLVISILDDPSVSRVMREAGFSSTAVKNCIEDCSASTVFYGSSVGVFSSPCSPSAKDHQPFHHYQNIKDFHQPLISPNTFWQTHVLHHSPEQTPLLNIAPHKKLFANTDSFHSLKEDVKLVFDVLLRKKKKNPVIVGDSVSVTEGLVLEMMAKIERGEVDHGDLKQTHFIKFQFSPMALKFMRREDVETNISELRKKVVSLTSCGKGAIIYTGDLKWTVGDNNNNGLQISSSSSYSPLDHIVEEVGRLISEYNNNNNQSNENNNINTLGKTRVWVMGTASYQTYMRCQMRQPSLETQWALQAVSVPSGGLGLSLHATSPEESRMSGRSQVVEAKAIGGKGDENVLSCCSDCVSNYEKETKAFKSNQEKLLPPWLHCHGDNSAQKDELMGLRRKWNRYCHSLHQGRTTQIIQLGQPLYCNQSLMGKSSSCAMSYPWWPNQNNGLSESASVSFAGLKPYQRGSNSVAKFRRQNSCTTEFDLGNEPPKMESLNESADKDVKITLDLGRSLFQSASTNEMKQSGVLAMALRENIPWQSENFSSIVDTLVDSLSGKKDTWMSIGGNDIAAKRRLACVVSESLFGSLDVLVHIRLRKRVNEANTSSEMLKNSLKKHKKLVVLVEDVDSADAQFLKLLSDRFEEKQSFGAKDGENCQVIFILTKEDFWSNKDEGEKFQDSVVQMTLKITEQSLDHKRKAESDLQKEAKNPRTIEKENELIIKKDFSRQSSFNSTLDLNQKAEEGDEEEAKAGEVSPISSDLTREISSDTQISSNGFLSLIENRFVFERDLNTEKKMRGKLVGKIKESFGEIFGGEDRIRFSVEDRVTEEVWGGSGYFLNSAFENWLREVFQTGLVTVKKGGKKDTVVIRLGFGGIVDKHHGGGGFMGTCLPNKVQVISNFQ